MARIAIGGFQHETNTFAPVRASYQDFEQADGWPGLTRGAAIFETFQGINLPLPGFIEQARALGHELIPLLWCSASPSAHVEKDAFERIAADLLALISSQSKLDALYLDLHGAMVTEHHEDGEGELLERIRAMVGPRLPIVVSLDLHANLTERMLRHASALVVCRTYPHVDLAETGGRAAEIMERLLRHGPLAKAMRRADFLVPLPWQCTLINPAASLYRVVGEAEGQGRAASASFAFGFPPADIAECGPAVVVYAEDAAFAESEADRLIGLVNAAEREFAGKIWQKDEAVRYAMAKGATATRPIILADTQDNPGAGGNSDSVDLLESLVSLKAEGAVFANLYDPETARIAHETGLHGSFERGIGAWCGSPGLEKFRGRFKVLALGDGSFKATGPFYRGNHMQLGPMALLGIGGTKIVVTSRKQQAADQAMLRHLGVDPSAAKILALKSSVHFRADFQPIAEEILVVAAAGDNPVDNRALPYRRLRKGLRLMPLGEAF
ncbi:M81 family metallopeptidase [Dongia rigui]|uniref:Microcystinase C n=1 Tax=Dongia rigui TaxID=940149 RepID=A0ABU5E4Q7_9PROT|nr:M81 family metallopeptidase [Dongia rigui]MDY0874190.1 M81 family metallopeptidase [Dongia rigui]